MKTTLALYSAVLLGMVSPLAHAGTTVDKNPVVQQDFWTRFDKGNVEIQGVTGAYFSFGDDTTLDQSWSAYRLGVMLSDPSGSGALRGNAEILIEVSGGKVFDGPGDYVASAGLVLRYNFIQPDSKLVPYVQLGAGGSYNDVYKDDQEFFNKKWGGAFSGAVGVRYLIGEKWSINLEAGYHFITNFSDSDRDNGLHAAGAGIGLSRFF